MRQLAADIVALVAFKLFVFDGTLCIFGVAFVDLQVVSRRPDHYLQ